MAGARRRRLRPRGPALQPGATRRELHPQRRHELPVQERRQRLAGGLRDRQRDLPLLPVRPVGPGERALPAAAACRRSRPGAGPCAPARRQAAHPAHRGTGAGLARRGPRALLGGRGHRAATHERVRLRDRRHQLHRRLPDPPGTIPLLPGTDPALLLTCQEPAGRAGTDAPGASVPGRSARCRCRPGARVWRDRYLAGHQPGKCPGYGHGQFHLGALR